jgi:hypothetical protein
MLSNARIPNVMQKNLGQVIGYIPPGHNAWVVGDEPFVGVDFTGMETYAKK